MTCPNCGAEMIREGTGIGCHSCGMYMGPGISIVTPQEYIERAPLRHTSNPVFGPACEAHYSGALPALRGSSCALPAGHSGDHQSRSGRPFADEDATPFRNMPRIHEGSRVGFQTKDGEIIVGTVTKYDQNKETGEITMTVTQFGPSNALGYI
jgi:hypothetical protein